MEQRQIAKAVETLLFAARLVEQGWTQKVFAKNAKGEAVSSFDRTAVCWCTMGALLRAAEGGGDSYESLEALKKYLKLDFLAVTASDITDWNDDPKRTQAEVVETFKATVDALLAGKLEL